MPITGSVTLPIAPRDTPWDAAAARGRILEECGSPACMGRGFLWRDGDGDYALGFCDMINGRLMIIPRGVAAAAGGRGIGSATIPEAERPEVLRKIEGLYARIHAKYETWPTSPFTVAPVELVASGSIFAAFASAELDPNIAWEGTIAIEGETTGDGRRIAKGALTWMNGPWPLVFNLKELGHTGMVVGTVETIRREGGQILATGTLSVSQEPETAASVLRVRELLSEGAVGVSVKLDDVEVEGREDDELDSPEVTLAGRVRHVAIVDTPAFDRARVSLVAAVSSVTARREWFQDPKFGAPEFGGEQDPRLVWQEPERAEEVGQWGAPPTLTADGQFWAHCALWGRCHVGQNNTCVRPPREQGAYRGYLQGERIPGIPTGPILIDIPHARLSLSYNEAHEHYANTEFAAADVTIGTDKYGIWAAGGMRSGRPERDWETVQSSALSADWREKPDGRLRLIAIQAINAAGFRVSRALAASGALITYGPGCASCDDSVLTLEERVEALELRFTQLT